MYKSNIGGGDADHITIRGHDLVDDLLEKHDFIDVVCLAILGRFPDAPLRRLVESTLIASLDHGVTPSALSTRLTLLGAPESMQAAVAAGLLGAGSRFLGTSEMSARFLQEQLKDADMTKLQSDAALSNLAKEVVDRCSASKRIIPGLGHPIHVNGDPRMARALRIAKDDGYFGIHCRFALHLSSALSAKKGRPMPLNAAGCKGAILLDMGLPPDFGKGLTLIGRTAGLVAHVIEEQDRPMAKAVWDMASAASEAGVQ